MLETMKQICISSQLMWLSKLVQRERDSDTAVQVVLTVLLDTVERDLDMAV